MNTGNVERSIDHVFTGFNLGEDTLGLHLRGRRGGSYSFLRATKSTMPPMSATAPAMGGSGTLCVLSRVA